MSESTTDHPLASALGNSATTLAAQPIAESSSASSGSNSFATLPINPQPRLTTDTVTQDALGVQALMVFVDVTRFIIEKWKLESCFKTE